MCGARGRARWRPGGRREAARMIPANRTAIATRALAQRRVDGLKRGRAASMRIVGRVASSPVPGITSAEVSSSNGSGGGGAPSWARGSANAGGELVALMPPMPSWDPTTQADSGGSRDRRARSPEAQGTGQVTPSAEGSCQSRLNVRMVRLSSWPFGAHSSRIGGASRSPPGNSL